MEKMLMNPCSGCVDTEENWRANFESVGVEAWADDNFESVGLIEVVKNEAGDWVEA